ncbi:polysaccharide deacetylase family protein [Flavihumibacter fluvii]|uniref:polysaccharide deacetylase family protein n=1 Tax=Flavihumibacter fluvii TaxID=2838157 RepID=UPI001BDDE683|nr:polysaccharide deacetylase family protein [Flavihumibacter fluvii]ULQ51469.1 polysaccharide deacetylase family protein [Flavihumibacter fluvii]
MLNFRNTSLLFILLALITWLAGLSWFWLLAVSLVYAMILFLGSYRVDSQFYMPVICKGDMQAKKIALSFDDGPAESYTTGILEVLKEKNTPAAFFCIGHRITGREAILQRAHAEGHLIGNHSYSHHALFDLFSASKMEKDLEQMNKLAGQVLQCRPRLFRPPYGVTNPNLAKAVQRSGMVAVGWNIRSLDTMAKNEKQLFDKLMRSLQPGAIILFHDTVKITWQLLPAFIDAVRESGYEIVRLDELINETPYA